jgi:hypothetical protein
MTRDGLQVYFDSAEFPGGLADLLEQLQLSNDVVKWSAADATTPTNRRRVASLLEAQGAAAPDGEDGKP